MGCGSSISPIARFRYGSNLRLGMCPVLIETYETDARFTATTVEEAVRRLSDLLHLIKAQEGLGN
jgi:hypothetical protein